MSDGLENRLRAVEDRLAIQQLITLYGFVMDERDSDGMSSLFTHDARLASADGVMDAEGLDRIVETYQSRYDALGATNHFVHGLVLRFDELDPDIAHGVVSGHAEVVRNDETFWVALRYLDDYRRTAHGWRIASRVMSYMYYAKVDDYAETMRGPDRTRVYGDARPADWPSVLHGGDLGWLRSHYSASEESTS